MPASDSARCLVEDACVCKVFAAYAAVYLLLAGYSGHTTSHLVVCFPCAHESQWHERMWVQAAAMEAYQRFQAQGQTAAVIATTGAVEWMGPHFRHAWMLVCCACL